MNWLSNQMKLICITIFLSLFVGCVSRATCWKIINGGQCVPIQSYEEWNKCVMPCENITIRSKTKPYKPNEWVRPRPYAYP